MNSFRKINNLTCYFQENGLPDTSTFLISMPKKKTMSLNAHKTKFDKFGRPIHRNNLFNNKELKKFAFEKKLSRVRKYCKTP